MRQRVAYRHSGTLARLPRATSGSGRASASRPAAEAQRLLRNLGAHIEVLELLELWLPETSPAVTALFCKAHMFLQLVCLATGRGCAPGCADQRPATRYAGCTAGCSLRATTKPTRRNSGRADRTGCATLSAIP